MACAPEELDLVRKVGKSRLGALRGCLLDPSGVVGRGNAVEGCKGLPHTRVGDRGGVVGLHQHVYKLFPLSFLTQAR